MTDTRQQFIHAAQQLYPQYGYQKLSVRLLAQHAQTSSGLFHHLFENKDEFMKIVFNEYYETLFTWQYETASNDPIERVRQYTLQMARQIRDHVDWICRMFTDAADGVSVVREVMRAHMQRNIDTIWTLVDACPIMWTEEEKLNKISYLNSSVILYIIAASQFSHMGILPDKIQQSLPTQLSDTAIEQRVNWAIQTLFNEITS